MPERPADIPQVLYKYITWREDKPYHKKLLTENSVFFASARHFNDPFDCSIALRYDLADERFRADVAKEYAKNIYPHMRRADRRKALKPRRFAAQFRKPEYEDAYLQFQEHVYATIGIFCMSGTNDNMPMWAYYSNAHEGLCPGFDMDKFWEFCRDKYDKKESAMIPKKVEYVKQYPLLIPTSDNFFDMAMQQILTKALDWEHEKEYRVLYVGRSDVEFILHDDIISEVIMGCRMGESEQDAIKGLLASCGNRLKLFKAEPKAESFGLDIVPVDY